MRKYRDAGYIWALYDSIYKIHYGTYKTEKEEMRSYRNYSATNGRIVRESDVSSPDKQKYDIDVIIPFIAKKFENGIF